MGATPLMDKGLRKSTRVLSEAVAAASEKRSLAKPIAVKGISQGQLVQIAVKEFGKLDVDPGYQRGRTTMVNQIVRALQAGGLVLDPVTLCIRKGSKDGKLWIVDGYQRVCAFQTLKLPFMAMVHHSDAVEAEAEFFISLNSRRNVSANVIVKAWAGPISEVLVKVNGDFLHPLYNRINFEQSSNKNRFAASTLVKGLLHVTGSDSSMSINLQLSRLDTAIKVPLLKARCEHLLRIIGQVTKPATTLPAIVVRALAVVARERWEDDVYIPQQRVIGRLFAKSWANDVILTEKYFVILTDTIRKIWR